MLLAGVAISYLVPGPMVRREIVALADEVTGGHWRERETLSRMNAVIARAEQAARGEKVEYRGRLVDPRYRFRTSTIVEPWTSPRARCAPAASGIWCRRTFDESTNGWARYSAAVDLGRAWRERSTRPGRASS